MTQHHHDQDMQRFEEVLDQPRDDRAAFIARRYQNDPDGAQRLRRLLEAHEHAAAEEADLTQPATPTARKLATDAPDHIGPYRILEPIGEGGMGVVYAAEQTEPIRRRVAVKIIKLGMDTKEVIARFEAERQALAMLDHPCVARVYDAGSTDRGRPYFVMELVKGLPLTQYCDTHHLPLRDRLKLFTKIAEAVNHAHQKGIIHRDLKPSNILVANAEGKTFPKVIDFGVAKAVVARLSDQTVFTEHGRLIGTPEYMSPEQAEMSRLDVDTRTDVYSLGVILYELLTGSLPFDAKQLREGGYAEIQRIIREVDPPKPSARLAERAASPNSRAALATRPSALKGDLDWIVMRAIDKDRTRRYQSAKALSDDVGRYLSDLPVLAGPPSPAYKARKFIKRHRYVSAIIAAALLAVATGVAGLAAGLVNARQAQALADRRAENALATADFLQKILFHVDPEFGGGRLSLLEVIEIASNTIDEDLGDYPEVEASVRESIGVAYRRLSMFDKAEPHLRRSLQIRRELLGDQNLQTARSYIATAYLLFEHEGKIHEPRRYLQIARESIAANNLEETRAHAWLQLDVGILALAADHLTQAENAFRICEQILVRDWTAEHPDVSRPLRGLAAASLLKGDLQQAERHARRAVALCEGERAVYIGARAKLVLAATLTARDAHEEADELLNQAAEQLIRIVGARHTRTAELEALRSELRRRQGNHDAAEAAAQRCLEIRRELLHPGHWGIAEARLLIETARADQDQSEPTDQTLLHLAEQTERALGPDHPLVIRIARTRLAAATNDAERAVRASRLAALERSRAERLDAERRNQPATPR